MNIGSVEELREQFNINRGKSVLFSCICEKCGKSFSITKQAARRIVKKESLFCRECSISETKKNISKEEKEKIKEKQKQTCLERFGYETKLTDPAAREKLKEIYTEERTQKILESKRKNGTLSNTGKGLKDPEIYKKTRKSLIENRGVESYLSILGKKRSLESFDIRKKEIEEFSEVLNDRDTFKCFDENRKIISLKLRCKRCNTIYSNTKTREIKRCPYCYPEDWFSSKSSKGERRVRELLEKKGVAFIPQKSFEDLKGKHNRCLRFDFYLPEYNTCIEYQGIQHFQPLDSSEDEAEKFLLRKEYDERKRSFCSENNIKLIEISKVEDLNSLELK